MNPLIIAHRGNRFGPNPGSENAVSYLQATLDDGVHVECDVWWWNEGWWLGHDGPLHAVEADFLRQSGVWCHAKNENALARLVQDPAVHVFAHEEDPVVLTSHNFLWVYPGAPLPRDRSRVVAVMPERAAALWTVDDLRKCYGVCTDYADYTRTLS